ncbi:MAG: cupin domain-containing protein [Acidimicrobiia bacterium]
MTDTFLIRRGVVDAEAGSSQPWGLLNFIADEELTGTPGVTVGTARILPGAENPLHIHPNCAEIILFLAGNVEHAVGADLVELARGDMLIVPAGMAHNARNIGSEPVDMIVIYNSGQRGFELADPSVG